MLEAVNIQVVERLPVFKALGDNTRYAIYLELARSPVPLSTGDVSDALALPPNTVRPPLQRPRLGPGGGGGGPRGGGGTRVEWRRRSAWRGRPDQPSRHSARPGASA